MGLGTLRTQQPKLPTRTGHAGEKLLEKSPNCAVEGREERGEAGPDRSRGGGCLRERRQAAPFLQISQK